MSDLAGELCGWELDLSCCPEWAGLPDPVRARALAQAVEVVWALSGRRFGLCRQVVRPCRTAPGCTTPASPAAAGPWVSASVEGGRWVNYLCGCGVGDCLCGPTPKIALPGVVEHVNTVTVDGQILPPDAYVVFEWRWLYRVDGLDWPPCQDLSAAPDAPGAFVVDYVEGVPVPPGGLAAAAALACEIGKACAGGPCRLPGHVTQLSRDGVSYTLEPSVFTDAGLTGLAEVDRWLRAVNPSRLAAPPLVYSPDTDDFARVATDPWDGLWTQGRDSDSPAGPWSW